VLEEQFKAVDAIPQVMPFSEVYSALQQRVIDGQENTNSNIYTKKFYEVQKYMSVTNHGYLGYLVVMSKKFWKSSPLKDMNRCGFRKRLIGKQEGQTRLKTKERSFGPKEALDYGGSILDTTDFTRRLLA